MIIDFDKLGEYDIHVENIDAVRQYPSYRYFSTVSRMPNGFLFILDGCVRYCFDGKTLDLSKGDAVYLPHGSRHELFVESEKPLFCRVDLDIIASGEKVYFSEKPTKFYFEKENSETVEKLLSDLCAGCIGKKNNIRMQMLIYELLYMLKSAPENRNKKSISPAVNYIESHYTEKTDCSALAELCFMSRSKFYNEFVKEMKMTPLAYKNSLLIKRAQRMLKDEGMSISETAFSLGFHDTAYFSRFFRKNTGKSASEMKKLHFQYTKR